MRDDTSAKHIRASDAGLISWRKIDKPSSERAKSEKRARSGCSFLAGPLLWVLNAWKNFQQGLSWEISRLVSRDLSALCELISESVVDG